MENAEQLARRFREVILNGTWVAQTNFKDQLSSTHWKEATSKVGDLNTIADLTFHVGYYIKGILDFFKNGQLTIKDKYSFSYPPVESEEEWLSLKQSLFTDSENFAKAIEKLSDEKLNSDFVDKKYGSYRRNIEAMIEHAYYHLGQVSLLKKWLASR